MNDCDEWTCAVDSRGYGHFRRGKKIVRAHRAAYEAANGPIPDGLYVLHRCDNKLCCNPDHLFLGSHADNMRDMQVKGRRKGIGNGVDNGRAKLTEDDVRAIRLDKRGKRVIAKEYGISPAQALRIRNREQWTHVE